MHPRMRLEGTKRAALAIAFVSMFVAACGGGATTAAPSTGATTAAPSTGAGSAGIEAAKALVGKHSAEITAWPGPTTAPAAATGKKIGVITCANAAEGCIREANGAEEGAKAIGWDVQVLDGQGDQQKQLAACSALLDSKVDAIVLVSLNDAVLGPCMDRAKQQGTLIINTVSPDPRAFGGLMNVGPDDFEAGRTLAAYIAANSGGNVAIFDHNENPAVADRARGLKAGLSEFGASYQVVYEISVTLSQIGAPEEQLMSAFLQSHPKGTADWVYAGFDAMLAPLVDTADRAGRSELKALSIDGNLQNLDFIRKGTIEVASVGYPLEWVGWAAIDELNRAFAGKGLVDEAIPFRLLTKDNLPEAGKPFEGDFDFRSEFKKLWGK